MLSCTSLLALVFLLQLFSKHITCINLQDTQPTSQPTTNSTLLPTSLPTIAVFPSTSPTSLPTIQTNNPSSTPSTRASQSQSPNLLLSSNPSVFPTSEFFPSFPTSCPSTSPTIHSTTMPAFSAGPTSFPTVTPSTAPTFSPSNTSPNPTGSPSSFRTTSSPSSVPTMDTFPPTTATPTSTPSSSRPSSLPSSLPSSTPSFFPSEIPSSNPTTAPSQIPTCRPSRFPTSTPSSRPTFMPTPEPAMLGKTWWFLNNVDISLHATSNIVKYTHVQVQMAVQNAFTFLLADNMQDSDRNKIYTLTQVYHPSDSTDSNQPLPSSNKDDDYYFSNIPDKNFLKDETREHAVTQNGNSKNSSTVLLHYHVQSWCASVSCMQSLRSTWANIIANPLYVVESLHEQGIRAIDNAQVLSMHTTITDLPPPIPPPLSPTRIIYIILGVILFVGTMYILIKTSCKVWENKHILRRWCRSRWENLSLPCYLCCYELQRSWWSGFSLASNSDEENLDSGRDVGQLSVHYDNNHFSWQHGYLDDRDREASQKLRPSARDSEQEEDMSLENGEIAMVSMPSRMTTVLSPMANRMNSPNRRNNMFSSEAYL